MTLKNILVHVDESKQCPGRLDVAVDLARDYGAHLTGLYVIQEIHIPPSCIGGGYIPVSFLDEHDRRGREAATQAKKTFNKRMQNNDVNVEWRCFQGRAEDIIGLNARYADLTIVSQADPNDANQHELAEMPAEVALTAGRPVLVMPYIDARNTPGKNVMVAWNASREATRAINDAMPILEHADQVLILEVNPDKVSRGNVPSADISLHLARHGIQAEVAKAVTGDIDVSDVILSRLTDAEMDLLVMGAYGHSRTRELIIGGATRDILRRMTIPVLISH